MAGAFSGHAFSTVREPSLFIAARFSLGRMLSFDVPAEVAALLRLVVAMMALLPLNVEIVDVGLVRRECAALLRLVLAVGTLVPLYIDVVLVGLVLRDAAVRLGPVFARRTTRAHQYRAPWLCAS